MRKNSVRKFIHAVLDCLPLLIIPIFAIYSMNHEINDYSVNTSGYEVRNKYKTNEVNNINDLVVGNIYHYDYLAIQDTSDQYEFNINIYHYENCNADWDGRNISQDETYFDTYNCNEYNCLNISYNGDSTYILFTNENLYQIMYFEYPFLFEFYDVDIVIVDGKNSFYDYEYNEFGESPSSSDFEVLEYVYNEGIVLDDTDIGSQLMYCLYNTTDKYFNMNRVFNLGNIWTWVSNTLFGGQPPISAYIVYNVIAYEFIMDVIFLLYSVFMFIIDFAEKCLDRFMGRANKC